MDVPDSQSSPELAEKIPPRAERTASSGMAENQSPAPVVSSADPSIPPQSTPPLPPSRINLSLELPPGARIRLTVESLPPSSEAVEVQKGRGAVAGGRLGDRVRERYSVSRLGPALRAWPYSLASTLFGLGLLIYFATRLIGLSSFPIYFFTDEAVQTTLAADFVANNFRDRSDEFLPTYFENAGQYEMSVSVYVQMLPYLLFGKSVFVTRLVSLLITVLGAAAVGLTLREAFQIPYWWSGVLFFSIMPVWFLHSRTAFEAAEATALYAGYLFFYLLYRYRAPRYLYAALTFGALCFYASTPAQLVVVLTGFLWLLSDWRYHWQNRRIALRGLALLALLVLPYVRYLIQHPTENYVQLKILRSYWLQNLPLGEKLHRYFSEYLYGLSPGYWFIPNEHDLTRHIMKGYGHILPATLPFAALGLAQALRCSFRHPQASAYRAVLIALLASPTGAALVGIGISRVMFYLVPAALFTTLGVSLCLGWLEKLAARKNFALQKWLAIGLFAILALFNLWMTRDALTNGPLWYRDYTLGGMQYGARQVFPAIQAYLQNHAGAKILLSPDWTNGADEVKRFFLPDSAPLQLAGIEAYMLRRLPLDANTVFVMMAREYQNAIASGKFADVRLEQTIPYPDDSPGFHFVRLRYADNVDQILAAEKQARRELITAQITLDGQPVQVEYPLLDMDEITAAFDGNPDSLIRSLEANPLMVGLTFAQPRTLRGVTVSVGGAPTTLTVRVIPPGEAAEEVYSTQAGTSLDVRDLTVNFRAPLSAARLLVEIKNTNDPEPAHVHVWEIVLR